MVFLSPLRVLGTESVEQKESGDLRPGIASSEGQTPAAKKKLSVMMIGFFQLLQ